MVGTSEYVSQMNTNLHLIFGCEKFLNDWLELREMSISLLSMSARWGMRCSWVAPAP
jgi:hypothetical protein